MKGLTEYISEARKPGFDTSWFTSNEASKLYNDTKDTASEGAWQVYLTIDNTQELWNQVNTLMKSAVRHADFDPEYCATCSAMDKIIRAGVAEYNKHADSEDRLGRLDKEFKKAVGMLLVCGWEE